VGHESYYFYYLNFHHPIPVPPILSWRFAQAQLTIGNDSDNRYDVWASNMEVMVFSLFVASNEGLLFTFIYTFGTRDLKKDQPFLSMM
jgi:hypothetical protein